MFDIRQWTVDDGPLGSVQTDGLCTSQLSNVGQSTNREDGPIVDSRLLDD